MKVYDPEAKKHVEMSRATFDNMWKDTLNKIDKKEAARREGNDKAFMHETTVLAKDAKRYHINQTRSFVVSGLKQKKKFDLSTWLWRKQIELERKFPIVMKTMSAIRRLKLSVERVVKYGTNNRRF
jgi:hypothetical protein